MVESAPQGMAIRLDVQSLQSPDTSGVDVLDVLEQLHKVILLRGGRALDTCRSECPTPRNDEAFGISGTGQNAIFLGAILDDRASARAVNDFKISRVSGCWLDSRFLPALTRC